MTKQSQTRRKVMIWDQAQSLIQAGDTSAVPRLIRDLRTSRDCERRLAAAYTLGFLNDRRAAKPLIHVISNRRISPRLRGQAAEALGYLFTFRTDRLAFSTLLKQLEDPSPEVRLWSVFAIGQMGARKAISALTKISQEDKANLPGWWSIAKEAKAAIRQIRKQNPAARQKQLRTNRPLPARRPKRGTPPMTSLAPKQKAPRRGAFAKIEHA
jgi:HEAT repeat protein